jgi:dolichyl-phosphate-mannose-protein mannosyltransferase
LLHSHVQKFPEGSQQQQVTLYSHKDSNNDWTIEYPWGVDTNHSEGLIHYLKDGDLIILRHSGTGRNLHSHKVPAPLTTDEYEVSAYGNSTVGDESDVWRVEWDHDADRGSNKGKFRLLYTRFRIRHVVTGCLLTSTRRTLPAWGFSQQEVFCEKQKVDHVISRINLWNIEAHWNERLSPAGDKVFKSNFLDDFIDVNIAMWSTNNALTPDEDKQDDLASSPVDWPFASVGLRMCGWGDDKLKFYLIGTPLIWWSSATSIIVMALILLVYAIRYRRGNVDFLTSGIVEF